MLFIAGGFLVGRCPATEDIAFFEREIRPIFVEHCYECHSADEEIKGGLVLDSREGWSVGCLLYTSPSPRD